MESGPIGPVCVWQTDKDVHALYDTNEDKLQQDRMMRAYSARAFQSEPQKMGMMHFFRKGTPLHGKLANGGPLLGWDDFPLLRASGEDYYRFYPKAKVEEDMDITWFTPEVWAQLMAEGARANAARPQGDTTTKQIVGIKCPNPKFEYRNRARHSPVDAAYLAEIDPMEAGGLGRFLNETDNEHFVYGSTGARSLCDTARALIKEIRDDCAYTKTQADVAKARCVREAVRAYAKSVKGYDVTIQPSPYEKGGLLDQRRYRVNRK